MDGTVILVGQTYTKDSIGQQIATETQTEVLCTVQSVTRQEWRSAGQNGIPAELVIVTAAVNYSGERIAIINGNRRAIYRAYQPPDSDDIELYLQAEVGAL